MSMYANSSEQYWKQRRKPSLWYKRLHVVRMIIMIIILLIIIICYSLRRSSKHEPLPIIDQRPNITDAHIQKCTKSLFSKHDECVFVCNKERETVPRPISYQACLNGCRATLSVSIGNGCRGGTFDDNMKEITSTAHKSCYRYQNMIPKPELYSMCRKYHKIGADRGFEMGSRLIQNEMRLEWERGREFIPTTQEV